MSSNLVFTFNGLTSDPFDDLFIETHGGTEKPSWESDDVDEVVEDDYSEEDDE